MDLQQELRRLKSIEGKVRGEKFRTHAEFIEKREGKEGLEKVEGRLAELGTPLKFEKVGSLQWYPVFYHPLILLVAQEIFRWTDEDICEMGETAAKVSFIGRIMIKYFLSPEKFLEDIAPDYWKKYYQMGIFETEKVSENKFLIRIKEYDLHPLVCLYNRGYFGTVINYIAKDKQSFIEETRCVHKGDSFHEFVAEWK